MTLEQRAARLWPNNPMYQTKWLAMVVWLGDRWLLANQVQKGTV